MFTSRSLASTFAVLFVLFRISAAVHAQEPYDETLPAPIVAPSDSGAYHAINQLPASIRSSRPFAREFYEFSQRAGSSGVVDNAAYLQTFKEAQDDMLRAREGAMKGSAIQSSSVTWTNIGLSGSNAIPSAGMTTVIVFDPQHTNIMYAGCQGGVWKSTDTGANWFEITDNILPNLSVATIAVDPVNTETIYVGTGNCYNGVPSYAGSGLFESTDGGSSFNQVNQAAGATSYVKVTVDPSDHNIVIASSFDKGIVYRSIDAGTTWKPVFSQGLTWDIVASPAPSSIFYLSSTVGIYKSTDSGVTWTKTTTSSNFVTNIGRSSLTIPALAPNKIFALVTDNTGSLVHLYLSPDAGVTWDSLKMENLIGDLFNPKTNAQGWYDLVLTATPNSTQTDTLYVDGVSAYMMIGTDVQLENGTGQWQSFSDYNHSSGTAGSGYPHVDHHSFAINPLHSNILYDGCDGGLYVNYQAGSNDVSSGGGWMLHSHGMITNRIYHLGLDRYNPDVTWVGAQDQGLWELTSGQDPVTFPNDNLGDVLQPVVSLANSNHIYAEGPNGQIESTSSLVNQNWGAVGPKWSDAVAWDAPLKMSAVSHGSIPSSSIIYVGRQYLWQTTDGGTNWTKLSASFGITSDDLSYCSAIGLPNWNANMIYAAGGGSSFQLSTNFGSSWVARTNPGYVTSINTSWTDPKFVLVTLALNNKKVMMSEDSGHTWTDVSGISNACIPGADANSACSVRAIAIDSTHPLTTWYAGTDFGVYETTDAGHDWSYVGPGLFACRDLQLMSDGVTLRVATFGRGIWEYNVSPNAVEFTSLSAIKGSEGTQLSWYVENEPAGAQYFVQRSVDGNSFQNIGTVIGQGASSERHNYSFADNVSSPGSYLYRIHQINADGSELYSNHVEVDYGTAGISLSQPYPNPYVLNSSASNGVSLDFQLPSHDRVTVRIYNIDGTLVRTLLDAPLDGGPHTFTWDTRDTQGNIVTPGAYLCSVQTANSGSVINKIMVVGQ